jgi:ribosome-binding factor A
MKRTKRSSQVADVIRTELSTILQRELSDPSLGFLTVTEVEVSPDLHYAKVFISSLDKPKEREKALAALKHAGGRIRHLLAQRAALRYTPELDFRLDETAERAASIDRLLQKAKNHDRNS